MQDHYFPNVPPTSLALESRLRRIAGSLDEDVRCRLYEILSEAHANFHPSKFMLRGERVIVSQAGCEIAFPRPLPLVKFSHVMCGYEEWLRRKYSLPGFVEVETHDVVIDCGAYVGGFSLGASKRASEVHAFEPEGRNFLCLSSNLGGRETVQLNQTALYSKSQTVTLNISECSVEHSLLAPDDGTLVERHQIQAFSLEDYCAEQGLTRIDFLKLEAEGVELEIFEGLGSVRPRKVAIDVSPERNGESPAGQFEETLSALHYEVRRRGQVMFARLLT